MKNELEALKTLIEYPALSMVKMHTRFGTIEYFVEDRDASGLPSIVCQCGDIYEAVKVFRKLSEIKNR